MDTLRDSVQACADVRCRPEDEDKTLLYNPRTDEVHILGPTEKAIYDLCDGRSIDAVVEEATPWMAGLGITDPERAGREIVAFLTALGRRKLVEYR